MLIFNHESIKDCKDEMAVLVKHHWNEVGWYKDKVPCDPDWDTYEMLDEAKVAHLLTARRDDGLLVGYIIFIRDFHLHSKNNLMAVTDVLYLHPNYRHGRNSYRLLEFGLDYLRSIGVQLATINVNVDHPFGRLCESLGMQLHEEVYSIYLGD